MIAVVFVIGIVQTFFVPERTRALLAGKRLGIGNVLAATPGIVTPFCSYSAVPLFIGFLSAGVPLGVTFSFLIAAPMVNEVALALLFGMFGWGKSPGCIWPWGCWSRLSPDWSSARCRWRIIWKNGCRNCSAGQHCRMT